MPVTLGSRSVFRPLARLPIRATDFSTPRNTRAQNSRGAGWVPKTSHSLLNSAFPSSTRSTATIAPIISSKLIADRQPNSRSAREESPTD